MVFRSSGLVCNLPKLQQYQDLPQLLFDTVYVGTFCGYLGSIEGTWEYIDILTFENLTPNPKP